MREPVNLYRHFSADGSLLYVGISANPLRRQREHVKGSSWSGQISEIKITQYPSRRRALRAERDAINNEAPIFNVRRRLRQPRPVPGLSPVINSIRVEAYKLRVATVDLAAQANVSFSNLYAIFRGEYQPNLVVLEALAKALRMKVTVR